MTAQPPPLHLAEVPETGETMDLIRQTSALFAGKHPAMVAPALASLMATWLSGHVVLGDPKETKRMREEMLKIQLTAVWRFVDLNDQTRDGMDNPQ
jgi:hypothetical protein